MLINSNKSRLFSQKKDLANASRIIRNPAISHNSSNLSFRGAVNPKTLGMFQRWGYQLSQRIPDKFYTSKLLDYVAKLAKDRPGIFEALAALGVTCTIRPLTIMAMPGAKREDKQYAAAKSIASGVVGYTLSSMIFSPLGTLVENLGKGKYNHLLKKPFPFKYGTTRYNVFSFAANFGSKFLVAIPIAYATFKMIPWLMEKMFPDRKKKPLDNYTPPIAANRINDGQKLHHNIFVQSQSKNGGIA